MHFHCFPRNPVRALSSQHPIIWPLHLLLHKHGCKQPGASVTTSAGRWQPPPQGWATQQTCGDLHFAMGSSRKKIPGLGRKQEAWESLRGGQTTEWCGSRRASRRKSTAAAFQGVDVRPETPSNRWVRLSILRPVSCSCNNLTLTYTQRTPGGTGTRTLEPIWFGCLSKIGSTECY